MRSYWSGLLVLLILLFVSNLNSQTAALAGTVEDLEVAPVTTPVASAAVARAVPSVLGSWDFETGPQGWQPMVWDSPQETYFAVTGDQVLNGLQSLWCGDDFCGVGRGPGYGPDWNQAFTTIDFDPPTGIDLTFEISYDLETGEDFVRVEYLGEASGTWTLMAEYTGVGSESAALFVPGSRFKGYGQIRFRVTTNSFHDDLDGFWESNGAVIIDNIQIDSAGGGQISFHDFEAETPGANTTNDGFWTASFVPDPAYRSLAALHDGSTVWQENDCGVANSTQLWGFFDHPDSANFGCEGVPWQGVIPYPPTPSGPWFHQAIVSPWIELAKDENGLPVLPDATDVRLEFDVAGWLPYDRGVFWEVKVRSRVAGCDGLFQSKEFIHILPEAGQVRESQPIARLIEDGATHIQVAVGVVNVSFLDGPCHTPGPLIDNVRVTSQAPAGTWWLSVTPIEDDVVAASTPARFDTIKHVDALRMVVYTPGTTVAEDAPGEPAVYAYVNTSREITAADLLPQDGLAMEWVASQAGPAGKTWHQYRLPSPSEYRYDFDLAEGDAPSETVVWQAGDRVEYFFALRDETGTTSYYSDALPAQAFDFDTAALSPMDFIVLGDQLGGSGFTQGSLLVNLGGVPEITRGWTAAAGEIGFEPSLLRVDVANLTDAGIMWWVLDNFENVFVAGEPSILDVNILEAWMTNPVSPDGRGLYVGGRDAPTAVSLAGPRGFLNFELVSTTHQSEGMSNQPTVLTPGNGCDSTVWGRCGWGTELVASGCGPWIDYDVMQDAGESFPQLQYMAFDGPIFLDRVAQLGTNYFGHKTILAGFDIGDMGPDAGAYLQANLDWLGIPVPTAAPPNMPAPLALHLHPARPNPFNPKTTINFDLPGSGPVSLRVYDLAGRLVRVLLHDDEVQAGRQQAQWDGRDASGATVASGVYFCQLEAQGKRLTRKLTLLK